MYWTKASWSVGVILEFNFSRLTCFSLDIFAWYIDDPDHGLLIGLHAKYYFGLKKGLGWSDTNSMTKLNIKMNTDEL